MKSCPVGLSTAISTSKVREVGSIAFAVRTSLPWKRRAGKLRQGQVGGQSGLCRLGVDLGHADVDPQLVGLRNVKQFVAVAAGAAGIDQGANIGIARGNHAGERSVNPLKRLQLLQPLHIGLRGLQGACLAA